jgi:glycerol-3-phosphate O-acyltransferase
VLGPFLQAYRVVGDIIERDAYQSTIDVKELETEALALGKQYLLQGKLSSPESVTSVVFESAVKLVVNRGLCASSPDMVERRIAFAEELRTLVRRLDTLAAIDVATDAGVLELE